MDKIIHVSPESNLGAVRSRAERLVDKVCRWAGDPTDPEIRQLVMDGMDFAVDRMNLAGLTLFRLLDRLKSRLATL